MKKLILIFIILWTSIFAQSITNKLGSSGAYNITDSSDNTLFVVHENGTVEVHSDIELRSEIYDGTASTGTSGQFLSKSTSNTKWMHTNDVDIIVTNPSTLSAGDRVYINHSSFMQEIAIPAANTCTGKTIEMFIGHPESAERFNFSEIVRIGNGSSYDDGHLFQLINNNDAVITLISDGTVWRSFGIDYWGIICFVAGTKIDMADGSRKNIEDVDVGDIVASCDFLTGKIVNKKVTKTFANPAKKGLVEITFTNGTKNTNTLDHRYFVVNKGWCAVKPKTTGEIEAGQLKVGDSCLVLQDGQLVELQVVKIERKERLKLRTYNFTVEETECYFANGILVHNRY